MTKDEIVKALRACGRGCCDDCVCFQKMWSCKEKNVGAADLIEQQAAKIKEFEREANRCATADEYAKLEKLREGLEHIVLGLQSTIENATTSLNESVSECGEATPLTGYFAGKQSCAREIMKQLEACLLEAGLSGEGKETVRNE